MWWPSPFPFPLGIVATGGMVGTAGIGGRVGRVSTVVGVGAVFAGAAGTIVLALTTVAGGAVVTGTVVKVTATVVVESIGTTTVTGTGPTTTNVVGIAATVGTSVSGTRLRVVGGVVTATMIAMVTGTRGGSRHRTPEGVVVDGNTMDVVVAGRTATANPSPKLTTGATGATAAARTNDPPSSSGEVAYTANAPVSEKANSNGTDTEDGSAATLDLVPIHVTIAGAPIDMAVRATADTPLAAAPETLDADDRMDPKYGRFTSAPRGPAAAAVIRPTDTSNSARTTAGSNWEPAFLVSSSRAAAAGSAFLYERVAVITSYASATATIRALSEI